MGGCAIGLLITDEARPPVRATKDVDLVAEVAGKAGYYKLASQLKQLGFKEDTGKILCRWRLRDLIIDVMPTDEAVLGFSNRWYIEAVKAGSPFKLPSGTEIKLISAPLMVATKIEAFYGRGKGDYAGSHDIEDIINLIDGRPELPGEIVEGSPSLSAYLREEVEDLLAQKRFTDTIAWHLAADEISQARVTIVLDRMRRVAGL